MLALAVAASLVLMVVVFGGFEDIFSLAVAVPNAIQMRHARGRFAVPGAAQI